MNTSTMSAKEFGEDVDHAFQPYTTPRTLVVGVEQGCGPSYAQVVAGAPCNPTQLLVRGKSEFVSGGFNRNTAFVGITLEHNEVVMRGESSLGAEFETYLREYDPNTLREIVADVNEGVDVTRSTDLYPDFVAEVRPTDSDQLSAVQHRLPRSRNSDSVAEFALFVGGQVTEMLRSGGVALVGPIAEVQRLGLTPYVIGSLTVEETKPRLCYSCTKLNKHTAKRSVKLEGADAIRREILSHSGHPTYGTVADEQSGYLNSLLSPESQKFFGFLLFGYVFVYRHPPFGWTNSCQLHQRNGIIFTGFHRYLGNTITQYIDDHNIMSHLGVDDSNRSTYLFLLIKGVHGGYWFGLPKCTLTPSLVWHILGLEVDGESQCYRVPQPKREEYTQLFLVLKEQLTRCTVNLHTLASFAGKTVYYTHAISMLRSMLNVSYACLANNGNLEHVEPDKRRPLWWELPRSQSDHMRLKKSNAALLLNELSVCELLVRQNRDWPFVQEVHRSVVTHWSDATPSQGGTIVRIDPDAPLPPGWDTHEVAFGGSLPTVLELPRANNAGELTITDLVSKLMPKTIELDDGNIGMAEGAALIVGLMTIDKDETMRGLYSNCHVDFHIDNTEMLWMFRRRRVKQGKNRLQKLALLHCLLHYELKWNMRTTFHYVKSADNPADAPSRDVERAEQRLALDTRNFLWEKHGPFELDWMATYVTALCDLTTTRVPYFAREKDIGSSGTNVFANNVATNRDGKRINGYCYPPFVMLPAVVAYAQAQHARVLLVHPYVYEPRPAWAKPLVNFLTHSLPVNSSERRANKGWEPIPDLVLQYTVLDFE